PELGNLQIPEWDMPLDHMEELAFHNNPDIRERSYQSRIAVKETHKAILSMLPGITLTSANKYDNDSLLESNHWYEWSTRLTWNVFNILKAPVRIEHAETGEKLTEMQRLALRMAVLAQVHVANHQFSDARRLFQRADKFFQINHQISDLVATGRIGPQSVRDSVYEKTSEIIAQLQRYQAYAKLQAAYGQLHTTVGLDIAPPSVVSSDLAAVTMAVENRLLAWERGDLARQAIVGNIPTRISLRLTRLLGSGEIKAASPIAGAYNRRNSLRVVTFLPAKPKTMLAGP
ncbi:MAG: TolC family protein, partial [Gammaproteobacteria bacterium]|nr:TolC family protein [Gammaproteobacteria bacterium]